jgi:hypothetical protein
MSDRISEVLDRIEAQHAATAEAEPDSALGYLQDVYKGRRQADPWRMRAALGAVQFESPKLTAMAVNSMTGQDFRGDARPSHLAKSGQRPQRPSDRTQRGAGGNRSPTRLRTYELVEWFRRLPNVREVEYQIGCNQAAN